MFTSTFGIPHRPAGPSPGPAHARPRERALLRALEEALHPDGCGTRQDRPCGDCDACQLDVAL